MKALDKNRANEIVDQLNRQINESDKSNGEAVLMFDKYPNNYVLEEVFSIFADSGYKCFTENRSFIFNINILPCIVVKW